jgi:23S rRNA pseudouridine1911/1915/1917 synthase
MTRSPQLTIVDETDAYLVVEKPPLLLTHPTKPNQLTTLWNELRKLLAFEIANSGQISIINRLDRETSGLVLVAKTSAAAREFGRLMQERKLRKEYLAIVWGWPAWERKTVDAPLDRQGKHGHSTIWLKQTIHPAGAAAETAFLVEQRFVRFGIGDNSSGPLANEGSAPPDPLPAQKFSLVRAFPLTGRTHQIRVHLASLGYPVVGDKIYGPNEQLYLEFIETGWTKTLERELLLPRHALHSAKLAIEGEHEWKSDLPTDLAEFCSGSCPQPQMERCSR